MQLVTTYSDAHALQFLHAEDPKLAAYVPLAHTVHGAVGRSEYAPAAHAVQLLVADSVEYLPPAHAVQAAAAVRLE